jgi:hypothetical protein
MPKYSNKHILYNKSYAEIFEQTHGVEQTRCRNIRTKIVAAPCLMIAAARAGRARIKVEANIASLSSLSSLSSSVESGSKVWLQLTGGLRCRRIFIRKVAFLRATKWRQSPGSIQQSFSIITNVLQSPGSIQQIF